MRFGTSMLWIIVALGLSWLAVACVMPYVMPPADVKLPGCQLRSAFSEELAVIQSSSNFRLGFVDAHGTIVIRPRFFEAGGFSQGLAAVQEEAGDGFGFIDRQGRMVIKPQFEAVLSFSEGLAPVRLAGKWGFIDRSGALRIAAQYDNAWSFSEGLARVVADGLTGFVNEAGEWVAAPTFFKAGDMREGLAWVCERSQCGFLDRTGKVAIAQQYDDAGSFSSGLAPVRQGERWGYVDRSGKMAIAPTYDEAAEFSEGLARVGVVKDASWDAKFGGYSGQAIFHGFIDTRGTAVYEPKILGATSFREGFSIIRLPSGGMCSDCYHYRLMARDGTFLPGRFDAASPFSGGMAVAKVGQHSYIIDRHGNPLVEVDLSYLRDAAEGLRAAGQPGRGFIDTAGKEVITRKYLTAQPFSEGLAFVEGRWDRKTRERGYIDRQGRLAVEVPSAVAMALPFTDGLALVAQQVEGSLRYGFMNRSGQIAIAAKFVDAAPFAEGLAAVKMSRDPGANDWGYINRTGAIAIDPRFRSAGSFSNGLAYVESVSEGRFLLGGVINKQGRIVADKPFGPELSRALIGTPSLEQYRERRRFSFGEGLIPELDGKSRGWFNSEGRLVIPGERFAHLGIFSEGRAPVLMQTALNPRSAWGFVDPKGNLAVEPRFAKVQPFSEGLACVRDSAGRFGYVTPSGDWAIPPMWFEEGHAFSNGRALVKLGGLWGYIDRTGRFAIPPRYSRAEPFSEGLAVIAGAAPAATRAPR